MKVYIRLLFHNLCLVKLISIVTISFQSFLKLIIAISVRLTQVNKTSREKQKPKWNRRPGWKNQVSLVVISFYDQPTKWCYNEVRSVDRIRCIMGNKCASLASSQKERGSSGLHMITAPKIVQLNAAYSSTSWVFFETLSAVWLLETARFEVTFWIDCDNLLSIKCSRKNKNLIVTVTTSNTIFLKTTQRVSCYLRRVPGLKILSTC